VIAHIFKINEEYGPHIIIDASVLNDSNYIKSMGLELKTYTLKNFVRYRNKQ